MFLEVYSLASCSSHVSLVLPPLGWITSWCHQPPSKSETVSDPNQQLLSATPPLQTPTNSFLSISLGNWLTFDSHDLHLCYLGPKSEQSKNTKTRGQNSSVLCCTKVFLEALCSPLGAGKAMHPLSTWTPRGVIVRSQNLGFAQIYLAFPKLAAALLLV